jgi:hypothetical protein
MTGERPVRTKHQKYLALAEEARRSALNAKDPDAKRSFEKLADGWQQLAEHVAKLESRLNP